MTLLCSPKVTHLLTAEGRRNGGMMSGTQIRLGDSCHGQTMAAAGIVMETINLPEGNAFGVDDVESGTPTVNVCLNTRRKRCSCVWVTLTEQKW